MKPMWLNILLLCTFCFWATGAAKYTHEALEHHGRDASVDDDDDDDDSSTIALVAAPVAPVPQDHSHQPVKHPCPVCQMLAGMVVDRAAPPALPQLCLQLVGQLIVADRISPEVAAGYSLPARGPPALLAFL